MHARHSRSTLMKRCLSVCIANGNVLGKKLVNFQGKAFPSSNWKTVVGTPNHTYKHTLVGFWKSMRALEFWALNPFPLLTYLPVFTLQLKAIKSNSSIVLLNKLFHFFQPFWMRYFIFKFNWIFKLCHKKYIEKEHALTFYFYFSISQVCTSHFLIVHHTPSSTGNHFKVVSVRVHVETFKNQINKHTLSTRYAIHNNYYSHS